MGKIPLFMEEFWPSTFWMSELRLVIVMVFLCKSPIDGEVTPHYFRDNL